MIDSSCCVLQCDMSQLDCHIAQMTLMTVLQGMYETLQITVET